MILEVSHVNWYKVAQVYWSDSGFTSAAQRIKERLKTGGYIYSLREEIYPALVYREEKEKLVNKSKGCTSKLDKFFEDAITKMKQSLNVPCSFPENPGFTQISFPELERFRKTEKIGGIYDCNYKLYYSLTLLPASASDVIDADECNAIFYRIQAFINKIPSFVQQLYSYGKKSNNYVAFKIPDELIGFLKRNDSLVVYLTNTTIKGELDQLVKSAFSDFFYNRDAERPSFGFDLHMSEEERLAQGKKNNWEADNISSSHGDIVAAMIGAEILKNKAYFQSQDVSNIAQFVKSKAISYASLPPQQLVNAYNQTVQQIKQQKPAQAKPSPAKAATPTPIPNKSVITLNNKDANITTRVGRDVLPYWGIPKEILQYWSSDQLVIEKGNPYWTIKHNPSATNQTILVRNNNKIPIGTSPTPLINGDVIGVGNLSKNKVILPGINVWSKQPQQQRAAKKS